MVDDLEQPVIADGHPLTFRRLIEAMGAHALEGGRRSGPYQAGTVQNPESAAGGDLGTHAVRSAPGLQSGTFPP